MPAGYAYQCDNCEKLSMSSPNMDLGRLHEQPKDWWYLGGNITGEGVRGSTHWFCSLQCVKEFAKSYEKTPELLTPSSTVTTEPDLIRDSTVNLLVQALVKHKKSIDWGDF